MSIIDWSDAEEMVGLLADYVRDAFAEEGADRERRTFLRSLDAALQRLALSAGDSSLTEVDVRLRAIREAQPADFEGDPVMQHVDDCIVEIERMRSGS